VTELIAVCGRSSGLAEGRMKARLAWLTFVSSTVSAVPTMVGLTPSIISRSPTTTTQLARTQKDNTMIDASTAPYGVLLLRIALGILFLAYGLTKVCNLRDSRVQPLDSRWTEERDRLGEPSIWAERFRTQAFG